MQLVEVAAPGETGERDFVVVADNVLFRDMVDVPAGDPGKPRPIPRPREVLQGNNREVFCVCPKG